MESSAQFEAVMRLPHRRHAFGVNAPALFRHIGFRIEAPNENPLTAMDARASVSRRDKLIVKINDALNELQKQHVKRDIYSFCQSTESRNNRRLLVSETLLTELKASPAQLPG